MCVRLRPLFELSDIKWASVADMEWLGWKEGGGYLAFEEELLVECQLLLCDVSLQDDFSYHWIWSLDRAAGYIVRATYNILTMVDLHHEIAVPNAIWQWHIPLKVSLFVWHLLRDRVPTKVNLFEHHIISLKDQLCVSGCSQIESVGHLFLDCTLYGSL